MNRVYIPPPWNRRSHLSILPQDNTVDDTYAVRLPDFVAAPPPPSPTTSPAPHRPLVADFPAVSIALLPLSLPLCPAARHAPLPRGGAPPVRSPPASSMAGREELLSCVAMDWRGSSSVRSPPATLPRTGGEILLSKHN